MEPFFFGQQQELFGAFHPAEGIPKQRGLLIASPPLHEGTRAHFALREVANRCAAAGYDVLRFDYCGQGNSVGRSADYTIRDWENCALVAADELQEISGSRVVSAIAVRFAAHLVAPLAATRDLQSLVLWDPLLAGEDWLTLLYEHRSNLHERSRAALADSDREFSGHETGPSFVADLRGRKGFDIGQARVSAVISDDYRHLDVLQRVTQDIEQVNFDCGWQNDTSAILYPTDIVQWICSRLN